MRPKGERRGEEGTEERAGVVSRGSESGETRSGLVLGRKELKAVEVEGKKTYL